MNDIARRLRDWNRWMNNNQERMWLLKAAADEITKLTGEVTAERAAVKRQNAMIVSLTNEIERLRGQLKAQEEENTRTHDMWGVEVNQIADERDAARSLLLAVDNALAYSKVEHPIQVLERVKAARRGGGGVRWKTILAAAWLS